MFKRLALFVVFFSLAHAENLWVNVDLLYWKPWEKSLVATNKTSPLFFAEDFTGKSVVHPEFKWSAGCRVGFGYFFASRLWDNSIEWTHYTSRLHQHISTNSNDLTVTNPKGMFPIWSLSDDILAGDYVTSSNLHWKLALNLVDLEWGRHLRCHRWDVRPFFGLRSGWIDQDIDIDYNGGIFFIAIIQEGVSLNGTDTISMTNNYWGIGPRVGIDPQLILGQGFSLYADAAVSGLCGYFTLKQKENYLETERFHKSGHAVRFRWICDAAGGIEWKTFLDSDRFALAFKLGWEYHIFFHQMQLKTDEFHVVPHNKNLDVQGVILSGRFDF